MVLLPKKPGDPLKDVLKDWASWRDGGPINLPLTAPQFACQIKRNFSSQDGNNTRFEEGMQGNILEERDNAHGMRMALIFIRGVTPVNTWVPKSYVDQGVQLTGNINDWKIEFGRAPSLIFFKPRPNSDKLARTIAGLLSGFIVNPASFTAVYSDYMSKNDINLVSEVIQKDIRDSGLYEQLSKDDCTLTDLLNASTCRINEGGGGRGKTGIYARFSKSNHNIAHWQPDTQYSYVGKTEEDFLSKSYAHPSGSHLYAVLNRGCTNLKSLALYIMDTCLESQLFYIAEQVLLCLMGTYKAFRFGSAVSQTDFDISFMRFRQEAQYCDEISSKIFAETGFVPVLQRPSFEVKNGANTQSPISEMAIRREKLLWLRTDYYMRDDATCTSYTVAAFCRHTPVSIHWKIGKELRSACIFTVPSHKSKSGMHQFCLTQPLAKDDGVAHPIEGTLCQVVIEVRLDGKAIRYPWARLPLIEVNTSYSQANSFAVRVEWEHPEGSGNWRFTYAQSRRQLWKMIDKTTPRPLYRWAVAYATLHWIFNKKPEYTSAMSWMPVPHGAMRVLQVRYDYMQQTVRFEIPQRQYDITRIAPNSTEHIRNQMHTLDIHHTRPTAADLEKAGASGLRTICDLCSVLCSNSAWDKVTGVCKTEAGETICSNCKALGLPICPWTLELKLEGSLKTTKDRSIYDTVVATIFASPLADVSHMSFQQTFRSLGQSDSTMAVAEDSDDEGVAGPEEVSDNSSGDEEL